jgi:hypothetical protein
VMVENSCTVEEGRVERQSQYISVHRGRVSECGATWLG